MTKTLMILAASGVLLGASHLRAEEPSAGRFDGTWVTVLACEAAAGAVPYSYRFSSVVKDSLLHGERGIKDTPGWLQLEGRILPDGSASIAANGLVGRPRAAVGERPSGTPYRYSIDAKFSANSGSGHRIKGRTCTVAFTRQGTQDLSGR